MVGWHQESRCPLKCLSVQAGAGACAFVSATKGEKGEREGEREGGGGSEGEREREGGGEGERKTDKQT